jgi:opacity protein-like surface antigen
MAPFESINVVAADSYAGNFATLVADLDGTVWFNPGNGDVTRMAVPTASGNKLFGSTANQTSTWVALYDDVIDPGVTNITHTPGGNPGYHITGGIADGNNPDLLWAQAFSFTPTGLNSNLLNRLSPEVYVSFQDYAMQATRTHQRTALSAPALAATPIPDSKPDSKGGCKDATPVTTAGLQWEFFAATDYFNVATTNSHNQADYELSGLGVMAGVRAMVTDRIKLAGYLAGDDGNVEGSLIDADGNGWSLGLLGEVLLEEKSRTHLTAGISYGRYTFDGTRGSASATASGWTHGLVDFDDLDCDSLELYIGVEGVIYQNDRFRLIPSLGLHYATGSMDSFTETTGVPAGSPIALEVNHENYDSALAEFSLLAEVDATNNLTLWAQLGASAGIGQDPYSTSGNFVKGSRTLRAEADGLSNDLWFIGLGANYKISDSISVNLGYRSEFRSDADSQNSFNLSCSFRF